MQIEDNRVYRVKAVAEMLDVSPSTIYRAIESGQLDAYKIGTGKGTLRIPGRAISAYLDECGQAAYEAYVQGGASAEDGDQGALTPAQADGLACVVCEAHFAETSIAHRPVGRSHTGSQVFACTVHADQASDQFEEVA
ncbi:excisionase family DNA binding protein [Kibdelosporangium banguiense]|uniref:Excisionase family DNA binding protein n=1 Tax=Kibdelosporangium banguiense TaxID=1365924 RepID=A0ABS4TAT5_9PSEU|nr:helix-turn-helix domain-containing protein [Kibdelosporangium banguiense]MBP2321543.1 excisionase family DNA binding protein [Kibdelosporangium banguiense]